MKKWVTKLLLILMFLIPFGQGRDVSVVKAASNTFLNKTKISIQKGEICKLILKNVKNGEKIKWNSSKKSIVTVKAKVHIPQELRIRSRGTERHSASN